ncbi:hypothetical protein V8G54_008848 [Vigna mungo]|uniref:Uncharacterized protein n=1 Tax=Vigna mungo TaxID=3915 RepID=A0AAQ3SA90_VIGMU
MAWLGFKVEIEGGVEVKSDGGDEVDSGVEVDKDDGLEVETNGGEEVDGGVEVDKDGGLEVGAHECWLRTRVSAIWVVIMYVYGLLCRDCDFLVHIWVGISGATHGGDFALITGDARHGALRVWWWRVSFYGSACPIKMNDGTKKATRMLPQKGECTNVEGTHP